MKPPYRVPSMAEIRAIPWNGYKVASTFSGCGGSSLGYKLAGFKVVWASEFIEEAQRTYRANHPDTILDTRDIRTVTADDVLDAIGLKAGELDVLDGSPPCSAFSTAGKREAGWGAVKKYSDKAQRVDDLFFEFARILRGVRPKVFIAENVAGLVKGTAKGYFKLILAELKACGYVVDARVLDAQWLGVPQSRNRLIFVGVRNDLAERGAHPSHPKPLPYRYSIRDACPWITRLSGRTGPGFVREQIPTDGPMRTVLASGDDQTRFEVTSFLTFTSGFNEGERYSVDAPAPTIMAGGIGGSSHSQAVLAGPHGTRKFTIEEVQRLCSFPDDFVLTGSFAQQWERLGRAVPPVMMQHIAATVRDEVLPRCAG